MTDEFVENLQNILYQTVEDLSNISPIPEINKHILVESFSKIFNTHHKLIDYIQSDTDEIVEIKKIKKSKAYLKQYISAFKINLKLYTITKDKTNSDKMILNIWLFELFMQDIEEFYKVQSSIHTFFLSNPESLENYKKLKNCKRALSNIEKAFIIEYDRRKYLKSLLEFFRCHTLTEKNIMTSLSIELYESLTKTGTISKYQTKEILEIMFYKLNNPTTVRVDEMDRVYIKTVVEGLVIFAYPSSNNIESLYNFKEMDILLSNKIEKYKDNPAKKEKYEKYISTKISPLRDKLHQ